MKKVIGNDAAAAYVGAKASTWRSYVNRGQAPAPVDRTAEKSGHALPVWESAQLDEWMSNRPGRGAPGRPRKRRRD